ncbi:MAG: hydantoinase/oxoprolinase family protein [Bryobacteraceae bacterium]|nr:hydantoinase/oxoprolinase family protein [Bryobacteraceae bacterium]
MRIGVDTGGTFTDFVFWRDGRLESFKLRSRPSAPDEVIAEGLARAGIDASSDVVHGSTVATNALLERKGARAAFITTEGFADLLEIGRQNRERLYDLTPGPKRLLIPRDLCFEVAERAAASGDIIRTPSTRELIALRRKLLDSGARSAAVCFLHAWAVPGNELAAAAALGHSLDLSLSHEVCPEFREYERASTTALNAYLSPIMRAYLERLEKRLGARVWIMQSNGGSITVAEASRLAVKTILSGPAGGVRGALETARASGYSRILGFDMGGTSTDVSLADGAPAETLEARVDGLPVKTPMLEIHTVGAGGGSIARIDSGGLLRVGPESAGADPGPACYGSGTVPTVTDAHVVLGRITAGQLAGGALSLYPERSVDAISRIARELSLSPAKAAAGILRVANATMSRAIRVVSTERGHDPRQFSLVAFGGCGGLHACEIADELGIRTVLIPRLAGALSALGMLLADRIRDYSASVLDGRDISAAFAGLETRALSDIPGARLERFADVRYRGQSYELTVPWSERNPARLFHALHEKTYGYSSPRREIEIVTIRLRARLAMPKPGLRLTPARKGEVFPQRRVFTGGAWHALSPRTRDAVPARWLRGPQLILDEGATTLIPPRWRVRLGPCGNLLANVVD